MDSPPTIHPILIKKKQILLSSFNMFFTTSFIISIYLTYLVPPSIWYKPLYDEVAEGLFDFIFGELWFGFFHYLFHKIPLLFQKIHKKHHEIVHPQGWQALYAHPIDVLMTNIGSMIVTHALFHHSRLYCIFIGYYAVMNTVIGAHTDKTPDAYHQIHHRNWNVHFGFGFFADGKGFLFDRLLLYVAHYWPSVLPQLKK